MWQPGQCDAITAEAYAMFQRGETDSYAEHDYYPDIWTDTHRHRRRALGWGLYGLLGIEKGDRDASMQQAARNYLLFDAPVGIVTIERHLAKGSWFDVGLYVQTSCWQRAPRDCTPARRQAGL